MVNRYSKVRREWRAIDTQADLTAIWRGERFEDQRTVGHALRVYEMAIRVEGWEAVKGWARPLLEAGEILNAQLVELAMRSVEQGDPEFFTTITEHLLASSPPSYFRFWSTLFATRHSSFGEKLLRAQLAKLSDYHLVKYRRQVRVILRRLRFRCKTPREQAIGNIAFATYKKYSPKAYPSEVFSALVKCHSVARNRPKGAKGQPVSKRQHGVLFAEAAAALGIWSVVEGIRTSNKLPRTLTYMSAMAPKMTDHELRRTLRIFDALLKTAGHKKASERVVKLAETIKARLGRMEVRPGEWAKLYPYLVSPTLRRVVQDLIDAEFETLEQRVAGEPWTPILIIPEGLCGRAFRAALLAGYALYRRDAMASLSLVSPKGVGVLSHTTTLWPHGYHATPTVARWQAQPPRERCALYDLIRATFPAAAERRATQQSSVGLAITALRAHLTRRATLDGETSDRDVPVIVLTHEPAAEERAALTAHLSMFAGAVLVLMNGAREWKKPLDAANVLHLTPLVGDVTSTLELADAVKATLEVWRTTFASAKKSRDRDLRHLLLGPRPQVTAFPQGPYR